VRDAEEDSRRVDEWIELARRGQLDAAWRLSDAVLERREGRSCWHQPRHEQSVWNGTSLAGRRVLVRCYHGLGDTLQYVRFAPLLRQRARAVAVWAQPELLPLLASARGIDQLLPLHDGTPNVDYDVDIEVMELAHLFRVTLNTIPAEVPYLHVTAAILKDTGKPRVGVVWRAGGWDTRRSLPFELLAPLLELPAIDWYSLQGDAAGDERHPRLAVTPLSQEPLATARLMRSLDLVISVDTMTAHLAGALAVPTWTLLPGQADWRWLEGRRDSPWYPTMRLFRQSPAGGWSAVVAEVASALEAATEPARWRQ